MQNNRHINNETDIRYAFIDEKVILPFLDYSNDNLCKINDRLDWISCSYSSNNL